MAGVSFSIGVDDGVGFALQAAANAAIDLTPAMRDIAGHLASAARNRFETGTSPLGIPWKKSARAIEEGGQTLVDTSDLRDSIKPNWGRDFAEAGPQANGGARRYAAIHQFGGTIRPRKARALRFGGRLVSQVVIPARPYLGISEASERYAIDALLGHIGRALSGRGAPAGGAA